PRTHARARRRARAPASRPGPRRVRAPLQPTTRRRAHHPGRRRVLASPPPPRQRRRDHRRRHRERRLLDDRRPARDRLTLATERREKIVKTKIDRKSTRLNSSHVKISYAVFCLKKKNQSKT